MPNPDYRDIDVYIKWCESVELDEVWKYCPECDEDYLVLENEKICPIINCDNYLEER